MENTCFSPKEKLKVDATTFHPNFSRWKRKDCLKQLTAETLINKEGYPHMHVEAAVLLSQFEINTVGSAELKTVHGKLDCRKEKASCNRFSRTSLALPQQKPGEDAWHRASAPDGRMHRRATFFKNACE